ncbi:MAG: adenosine kinase [Treponema sp.]|jgi:sugar/nucleoside kinase (ribokinase family)|nr:adenosine kinase [Treponema sp.]
MKLDILCIGNAIIDVFALLDRDMLDSIGLSKPVQHIEHEKIIEILSLLPEFTTSAGGGSANVAKIAAMLGLDTGFAGAIGSVRNVPDHFAALFEQEEHDAGVSTFLAQKDAPTGICLVLQGSEGETYIAASPAAASLLSTDDIPKETVQAARVIVIDGYILEQEALVRYIMQLATEYGTVVALDLGSTAIATQQAGNIAAYCRDYPLILFMNEEEAGAFYHALNPVDNNEESELEEEGSFFEKKDMLTPQLYDFFKKQTAHDIFPLIAIKLGPKGALVFANGAVYREEALAVIPLETTGAGDAFCAAFLAAWIRDKSLAECISLGNKVASHVLDVPGTHIDRQKLSQFAKTLSSAKGHASSAPL